MLIFGIQVDKEAQPQLIYCTAILAEVHIGGKHASHPGWSNVVCFTGRPVQNDIH